MSETATTSAIRAAKSDGIRNEATRIRHDLLDIAQMFADAEHYQTAIQIQGFATLILIEAERIATNESRGPARAAG